MDFYFHNCDFDRQQEASQPVGHHHQLHHHCPDKQSKQEKTEENNYGRLLAQHQGHINKEKLF